MEVFASGAGCGLEPSMFTQETADFVAKRMEMWKQLAKSEREEEPFRALARKGNWRELSQAAERASWICGVRLLSLLLLMEDDSDEESAALAEKMLPPDLALLWAAYRGKATVDERIEKSYGRVLADVAALLGNSQSSRFAAFAGSFSPQGRMTAARVLMQAEAWALAFPLLEKLDPDAESMGEAWLMKGVCLYHLGRRTEAKQALEKAQEIAPTAEAASYLQWLEEAKDHA
jgi:tetratricopeptide (TPR) repeat protein